MTSTIIPKSPNFRISPKFQGSLSEVDQGEIRHLDLSSDGSTIAYSKDNDIFLQGAGQSERNITQSPDIREESPLLSADGSKVAYEFRRGRSGNQDVGFWNGTQHEVVSDSRYFDGLGDISEDGEKVIIRQRRSGTNTIVWKWENEKLYPQAHKLKHGYFSQLGEERASWLEQGDVVLKDQNGRRKNVTNDKPDQRAMAMSEDGTRFAYYQKGEEGNELYLKDVREDTLVQLPTSPRGRLHLDLSSDGERLTWIQESGDDSKVMLWEKGETQVLADGENGKFSYPKVSDDGQTVSWLWHEMGEDSRHRTVYRFDRD